MPKREISAIDDDGLVTGDADTPGAVDDPEGDEDVIIVDTYTLTIDKDSSGFEHAAILADLDEDGVDELYVALHNAFELIEAKQRAEARATLLDAIRLAPDFGEAYLDRGDAYMDQGNLDEAVADFTEARGLIEKRALLDTGHPVLRVVLGNDGFELVGFNLDRAVILGHPRPLGIVRRPGENRPVMGHRDEQAQ